MAASSGGGQPPPANESADSDEEIMRAYFDWSSRDAAIQAAARAAAQEALMVFAEELVPAAADPDLQGSPGAVEPSAAASSGGASNVLAASATGVTHEVLEPGVTVPSATADAVSPKRKRETQDEQPAPPSPEDDAAWNLLAAMSQSPSSSSLESPLRRVRLSESPTASGVTGSSASSEATGAVPVLPVCAAEENGVGGTQAHAAEDLHTDADVMGYLRSTRSCSLSAAGAESSAALHQPADTSNAESMSQTSESCGSTTVDYSDSDHQIGAKNIACV